MDIYTTLAAAAGEPDIARKVVEEYEQPIDGVNYFEYWMGKSEESARDHFFYYYESSIKAILYKQWLNEPVQHLLGEHTKSLTEYPPVQKAASFDFSALMEQLASGKQ